eukprot:CAMPEP_0197449192 /NCGR_PEP_ID=MMETSP1175-20131217/20314_1 /TAXON_ID=1003142 /ORGANISM="Triceratium dubium, Strain CCMP147" /LENGTH=503 /DNA_ID=CAMNT_0042981225 /DNA_START=37 /DNA_END=1548 /DNA_ORIENTATION=+
MKLVSFAAAALFAAASAPSSVWSLDQVYSVHGSGTTNPSKCIWMHMQNFMDRAKKPLHLTYRAVGSSTGQKEFIGADNNDVPFNYFGSGDIPISTDNYNALEGKGIGIVHLPFVLGAISLFHNVPGVPDGAAGLNLTSCLLSKIFKREITIWDDAEILAINPNLSDMLPSTNFPIKVARRVHGSSSTASVTEYLNTGCSEEWPTEMVGKTVDWHPDTMECEGSGGMTACIRDNEGAIGYIDAGHGHEEGLTEIELLNADGNYISSKRAAENGGIGDAAGGTPGSADADFGEVKLLNRPGTYTWPIVAMSYIYVRKDLSFIEDPVERALLKAFLKYTLLDEEEIKSCSKFGFTPVPDGVRQVALNGLEMLEVNSTVEWTVEIDTIPGGGQGDYVISKKRRTYAEYDRSTLAAGEAELDEDMVSTKVEGMVKDYLAAQETDAPADDPKEEEPTSPSGNTRAQSSSDRAFTDDDAQKLQAALVLSAISFSLWILAIIGVIAKKMCG